jgi:hypothetical protein
MRYGTSAAFALALDECRLRKADVPSPPHRPVMTACPPGCRGPHAVRLYTLPLIADQQSPAVLCADTWMSE